MKIHFFFLICFIKFHLYPNNFRALEKCISLLLCVLCTKMYVPYHNMLCAYKWFYLIACTLHCTMLLKAAQMQERMLTYKTSIHLQILESYKMCIIPAPEFSSIFNTILLHKTILRKNLLVRNGLLGTTGIAKTYWHFN